MLISLSRILCLIHALRLQFLSKNKNWILKVNTEFVSANYCLIEKGNRNYRCMGGFGPILRPTSTGLSRLQVTTGANRDALGKQDPIHVISLDPTRVHHASWALVTVSRRRRTHVLPQLSLACRLVVSNRDALPPHSEFRRGTELSSIIRRRLEQQSKAVVQIEVRHLEIDVLLSERLGLFRRLAEVSEDGIVAVHEVPVVLLVEQELGVRNAWRRRLQRLAFTSTGRFSDEKRIRRNHNRIVERVEIEGGVRRLAEKRRRGQQIVLHCSSKAGARNLSLLSRFEVIKHASLSLYICMRIYIRPIIAANKSVNETIWICIYISSSLHAHGDFLTWIYTRIIYHKLVRKMMNCKQGENSNLMKQQKARSDWIRAQFLESERDNSRERNWTWGNGEERFMECVYIPGRRKETMRGGQYGNGRVKPGKL